MQQCTSVNINDQQLNGYYDETNGTGTCDPRYFDTAFQDLKRETNSGCLPDSEAKLRRLLNKEVRCHNRNRANPNVAGERPPGPPGSPSPYDTYNNIVDYRGLNPNMQLYQKEFSEDVEKRSKDAYVQEINDNCSIVALHNMGILCRDLPVQLRRFNPDPNAPAGNPGINLNLQQIYRVFTREYMKKYPNDTVLLASYETPEQALRYIKGEDIPVPAGVAAAPPPVPRLEPDHVTLMMIEYFNFNFDPALPIGVFMPGIVPPTYNYPYHAHCVIVLNDSSVNRIFVLEPFKRRQFLWLEYFEYFKTQINLTEMRAFRESSIASLTRANALYRNEYTNRKNAGDRHEVARNRAKTYVRNYNNPDSPYNEGFNRHNYWMAHPVQPNNILNIYGPNTTLASRGVDLEGNIIRRIYLFHFQPIGAGVNPNYNRRVHSPLRKRKASPKRKVSLKRKASPKRKVSLKRKASPKRKVSLKRKASPKRKISLKRKASPKRKV